MKAQHILESLVILVTLLCSPPFVCARTYTVTAGGDRLEFVPQPDRGYVIKLAEKTGGIQALAGLSALDAGDAREVRGLDRHGVWTVENEGPAGRNEETIRSLRASGQVAYAAPLFSSNGEAVGIIPEIVIRVKPGTDSTQVEVLCEKAGCTIKKRMEFTQQEYLLEVLGPDAEAVFAAMEQLGQAPEVEWACPNTVFRPKLSGQSVSARAVANQRVGITSAAEDPNTPGVFPNDEYFPMQWHLHNTGQSGGAPGADIRAPEAWEITTGDANTVVAVIDCGVDRKHPDLISNLVPGYDFYDNDDQPDPASGHLMNGHGTLCAGLVAAQADNSIGVAGVAWHCKIMPIRIFGYRSDGTSYMSTEADIATAFRWAADKGAHVLSNSWVFGYGNYGATPRPILRSAIVDVTKTGGMGRGGKGCVVLFASGNDSGLITGYPHKYPEVIAVGATDHNDVRCYYSNYGPELAMVGPSGPGYTWDDVTNTKGIGWLWTTDISGLPGFSSDSRSPRPDILDYWPAFGGTSAAAPVVAGVAALIVSVEPNLTGDEVRHFLERSAKDLGDPGRDDYYGWGRVDARAALDMVLAKRADLNSDWKVDEQDLALLNAAIDANNLSADIAPAAKRDGIVDAKDLELLTRYLGTVIPELGLIAHWKLDEAAGAIAHNATGDPAYNATVMGAPLWQPEGGKIGGALQLSGPPNLIRTKLSRDPSQGSLSVFAWVKGGLPGQVILSQAGGANWLLAATGTGVLKTDLKSADRQAKSLTSTVVITDGNWHRVGLSWDGSHRILYVDDVEVAKDTQASLTTSSGNLYLGAGSTMSPTSFWKGLIDDVRIYNRAVKP